MFHVIRTSVVVYFPAPKVLEEFLRLMKTSSRLLILSNFRAGK